MKFDTDLNASDYAQKGWTISVDGQKEITIDGSDHTLTGLESGGGSRFFSVTGGAKVLLSHLACCQGPHRLVRAGAALVGSDASPTSPRTHCAATATAVLVAVASSRLHSQHASSTLSPFIVVLSPLKLAR